MTASPSPGTPAGDPTRAARRLLRERGAESVDHPGGTLMAHLDRVHHRLIRWNARPALQLAGLCHALYGTDGFPTALVPVEERARIKELIGDEAESLVYFYASCDRRATYPRLGGPGAPFRDRFTGRTSTPAPPRWADFAELTAANELDLIHVDAGFRTRHGPALSRLLTRMRPLLSPAARRDHEELSGSSRG